MPGFWVALADPAGYRVAGSEVRLWPQPTDVDYPAEVLGTLRDTADSRRTAQRPTVDGRPRAWEWAGYPSGLLVQWDRQWALLRSLDAVERARAGQTPYIYVKEDVTGELTVPVYEVHVAATSGSGAATLVRTTGAAWTPDTLAGATVEVLPTRAGVTGSGTGAYQTRAVVGNGPMSLTVAPEWDTVPDGARVVVRWAASDWLRARAFVAPRRVRKGGGFVRYDVARFEFVPDPVVLAAAGA